MDIPTLYGKLTVAAMFSVVSTYKNMFSTPLLALTFSSLLADQRLDTHFVIE
jgi:hypothetical protein